MARQLLALVTFVVGLGGCAGAISGASMTTTYGLSEKIPVTVPRPDGVGPFPAIVLLHDCSGVGPRSSRAPARWARELVARGYVVVIPDSFTTRGLADGVCTVPGRERRADVSPQRRAQDAYAALAHTRGLPFVDGRRVGLMGGSHGGATTLTALMAPAGGAEGERPARFAAGVALYPRCASQPPDYRPAAPLLILIGDKDDWTPAEPCRSLVETARQASASAAIKVYPGAHHSFDSPSPVREVLAFFDRYLSATNEPR